MRASKNILVTQVIEFLYSIHYKKINSNLENQNISDKKHRKKEYTYNYVKYTTYFSFNVQNDG